MRASGLLGAFPRKGSSGMVRGDSRKETAQVDCDDDSGSLYERIEIVRPDEEPCHVAGSGEDAGDRRHQGQSLHEYRQRFERVVFLGVVPEEKEAHGRDRLRCDEVSQKGRKKSAGIRQPQTRGERTEHEWFYG